MSLGLIDILELVNGIINQLVTGGHPLVVNQGFSVNLATLDGNPELGTILSYQWNTVKNGIITG